DRSGRDVGAGSAGTAGDAGPGVIGEGEVLELGPGVAAGTFILAFFLSSLQCGRRHGGERCAPAVVEYELVDGLVVKANDLQTPDFLGSAEMLDDFEPGA